MQTRKLLNWWQTLTPIARYLAIALLAPLLVLNGWAIAAIFNYFHSLIVILVGASVIAFLLNYPVSWMENHGAKREQVAILVFLLALSILLALGVTLFPLALTQAQQLVARLPDLIDSGRSQLMILNGKAESVGLPINLDALAAQINDRVKGQLQSIAGQVLNLAVITVTSLLDFLLTMVLTFYLLQHGGELWQSLVEWLPSKFRAPFSKTVRLSFQNFFITQLILSTCMASALIPTFLWLKVPFGLLFGLTIGVMALIPFGGSVGIALTTSLVSLQDVSMGVRVLIAAVIVQQILENLIAPRILGSFTGLNPVWILISVLTGARIGGLLGVIVAVPCAVVIKSIISAIRPSALSFDPEDSSLDDIATPMTPEASPKIEPNNSLSIS
ncbi:MAG: AI-2E family transporter [Dolichospermum sp. JUN01]|jgi:predicted PurR-regulated permease PerM|uniref:AI-2E family transporter n=1 Tax=Dolichospermum flos-aquae CCAP 1403/13F TaxID=315271 RepID=A0A6H2C136_DOLFA|nr:MULTISPECIES: AI-2E family transporter [Dolichospermum]MBO1055049.1 AI-2E family transporter [Dolichospermum sp. JUN01]MBS9393072.1 AI-2E family transporter [Dolichospermum sp. OL01]MCO5796708.1 AI-2E family transporter [Dolichospermum sp. OL03]MCS6280028.1 AI-2E family transporter [Dolichospermum sp.]QSV58296.1 MAG: AI-2E family transporter [Dolichospermum sp. LBC05a]